MDEQQEKNQSEGFVRQQTDKGKDLVKDQAKKKAKQKILKFLAANPEVLAVIAIVIVIAILLVVFLGGALYVIDEWKEENVNSAKQGAITYAYPDTASTSNGSFGVIDETKLVFIGDSWIEGLGQSGVAKTGYINGAIGKNANYFDGKTMNIPSDASAIVIEFGLNNPSAYGETQKLAEDLHTAHPNLPIFILKTSNVASGFSESGYDANKMNSELKKYNDEMKKWCEGKDYATFLESVTKTINGNNGNGELLDKYKDGTYHLNQEGYKAWYKDIAEEIASKSGSSFLDTAKSVWEKVCSGNYSYGASSIPCVGTIDCSAYVTWVLYEYGYKEFTSQIDTEGFRTRNWNKDYGWTEINVNTGEDVTDKVQPGDILVRSVGTGASGHINIIVKKEGNTVYGYDCGSSNNWNSAGGNPIDVTYFMKDSSKGGRHGKIIRVTNSSNTTNENSNTDPNADPDANKVVIQPNKDKTAYEISYNDDKDNIKEMREKFEKSTSKTSSGFTDLEIGILGALMDNGANLDDYTEKQLHCFPAFIKAEACTGLLDLRPNSKKFDGKEISDNYVPAKLKDLKENEVPGTVLVQRTNTNTKSDPIILEYKKPEDFNKLVENNDFDAVKYFTVSEDGKLIIAEWTHTEVKVSGDEYPENISDGEKTQSKDEYNITTESFSYREITKKYTMPFELLVQLLIITEKPEFCMDLVEKYVTQSKMVINIEEDETITNTVENRVYDIHDKDKKIVTYSVEVGGNTVLKDKTKFLENMKDDTGETCTNYSKETRKITVDTTVTSHSYSIEMTEIDTWLAHYKKTYPQTVEKDEPTNVQKTEDKPKNYTKLSDENDKSGNDKDAKEFVKGVKEDYESLVENIVPKVRINSGSYEDSNKKTRKYKTINVECGLGYTTSPSEGIQYDEVLDAKGKGTGVYNLPSEFIVTTNKYNSKEATIPSIPFIFALSGNSYVLANKDAKKVEVPITNVNIKKFEKIDKYNTITTNVKKFEYDGEPTKKTHIYATKSGKPGKGYGDKDTEYEKFLDVYDNNSNARNQISSIHYWLFEMMENNENTVELVDDVKYLLYMYNGRNYGVTKLDLDIFEPDEFATVSEFGSGTGWWWPIGSKKTQTVNGVTFANGTPDTDAYLSRGFTVGGHTGLDIASSTGQSGVINIIAARPGKVILMEDGHDDANGNPYRCPRTQGFANMVKIDHGDGTVAIYAHLAKGTITVNEGDTVQQGQLLAKMGDSGNSNGTHLHFEIRENGTKVDPFKYVDQNNPRPAPSLSGGFTLAGKSQQYYNLTDDKLKIFAAVVIGEGGTDEDSVFWTASAMFNRIDVGFYGDHDAWKILESPSCPPGKGWSEVYNNGSYKNHLGEVNKVMGTVKEVMNGKRAHKYIDFACEPLATQWINSHPGAKHQWFKGNMYCDWRDSLK